MQGMQVQLQIGPRVCVWAYLTQVCIGLAVNGPGRYGGVLADTFIAWVGCPFCTSTSLAGRVMMLGAGAGVEGTVMCLR